MLYNKSDISHQRIIIPGRLARTFDHTFDSSRIVTRLGFQQHSAVSYNSKGTRVGSMRIIYCGVRACVRVLLIYIVLSVD